MDAKGYHAVKAMTQLLRVCGSSMHYGFSIEKLVLSLVHRECTLGLCRHADHSGDVVRIGLDKARIVRRAVGADRDQSSHRGDRRLGCGRVRAADAQLETAWFAIDG